jgi:hypothetical protein
LQVLKDPKDRKGREDRLVMPGHKDHKDPKELQVLKDPRDHRA